MNINALTVSQVNTYIKAILDENVHLKNIYIVGEISNFLHYFRSGHMYFTLKDDNSQLKAVMFSSNAQRLKFEPSDGRKVLCRGRISVYDKDGAYQFYVDDMQPDGIGTLAVAFEQLKDKLSKEGLFDEIYKKPIPKFPRKIGVATSDMGAAIEDIKNITKRRYPIAELVVVPTVVQGDSAPADICKSIKILDLRDDIDVIIVGRGGGSLEDLWAFNEKIVAEAIFNCNTPIISAVGHETDTTIADYVSDRRAPTPSAAAELAVFDYMEFENKLQNYRKMLTTYEEHFIEKYKLLTKNLENSIQMYSPKNMLLTRKQYISDLQMHLTDCFHTILDSRKHMLQIYAVRLNGLSPLNKISKGFAYVANDSGESIKTVEQLKKGDNINLTISDGKIKASVLEVQGENNGE